MTSRVHSERTLPRNPNYDGGVCFRQRFGDIDTICVNNVPPRRAFKGDFTFWFCSTGSTPFLFPGCRDGFPGVSDLSESQNLQIHPHSSWIARARERVDALPSRPNSRKSSLSGAGDKECRCGKSDLPRSNQRQRWAGNGLLWPTRYAGRKIAFDLAK